MRRASDTTHPSLLPLCARFRVQPPRLLRSTEITTPLLALGNLVLPVQPCDDEALILAHELAHVRRHDLAWEFLLALIQALFWFHPLVWFARREESLAREQAADALALACTRMPPADYARALLNASLQRSQSAPLLTVGAILPASRLRRRLSALAQPALSRPNALVLGTVAAFLATLSFVPWRAVARQASSLPTGPITALSPHTLEGTVTFPDGRSAPWVLVALNGSGATRSVWARNYTDHEGHFKITGIPAGNYHLLSRDAESGAAFTLPTPTEFAVSAASPRTHLDLTLVPAALIFGRITDTAGKPRSVSVHVGHAYTSTDRQGHYALTVPAGTATVYLGGTAYRTVPLSPNETQLLDLTLRPEIP